MKFTTTESLGISDDDEDVKGKKKILQYALTSVSKQDIHFVAKKNVIDSLAKDQHCWKCIVKSIKNRRSEVLLKKNDDQKNLKTESTIFLIIL